MEVYTELMTRRLGPYCILNVGSEYLKIFQDGVEIIESMSLGTLTSVVNVCYDTAQYSSVSSSKHENPQLGKQQEEINNMQEGDTCVVEKIVKCSDVPEEQR